MSKPIYSTTLQVEITCDTARDFCMDDPDSFVNFMLLCHQDAVVDYIRHCPEELSRFVRSGGLSEEAD